MAEIKDRENALIMETTKGKVVIELFPDLAPGHVARIKNWPAKAPMTAWSSTASSKASWRRPATSSSAIPASPPSRRRAPAWAAPTSRT